MRRRRSSGIGAPIARSRFLIIAVAVFAGLGLAWWAATGLEMVKPIFLPSPASVATQLGKLWADGTLLTDLEASIYRISVGF
ncbi:MAG: ABC transporter permease, partial [Mesorhizobium sp.]